ncbi:transposase [Planococcus halocryophilus]|uniref:transposase n=1 Tax=Planococcus halocryophilus TaxID=1215089 RepID=UPI001F0DCC87|nr:transposase [Planococcus halocryophilus]MCH4826777.1 transposase [Planococcus halocryophilus]
MTRKRAFNPHSYYHVIMRGNNRQPIFKTKEDMFELKRAFQHIYVDYPFKILAYCFMTNHYHILIKAERDPLHKIMGLVNRRYSMSYAKRYRHIGRIYQKRYFAKEVDSRLGLLTVSSYIHRNPIQTKKPMVERLELYPYSSFPLYWDESLPAPAFLDRELLKSLLPEPFEKNNTAYCMYCLTYAQNAEEDSHVEDMEPPVM